MSAQEAVTSVRGAVLRLEAAVAALRREFGDTLGVRRVSSDVRRLIEDLDELGEPQAGRHAAPTAAPVLEEIPDTPYDRSMWADAEDEGFGAPDRHAP